MSAKHAIKTLVPEFLHRFPRFLLTHIYKYRVELERKRVPHTMFPLEQVVRDAILDSLRMSDSAMATESLSKYNDFPHVDELIGYWAIVNGVTQILAPLNPSDKYFDWNILQNKMSQGLLKISKDLFAVWAAIHKRPKVILEIGCRTGKSIAVQLFAHPNPDMCTVFLIDPFVEMGSPKMVLNNLSHLHIPTDNIWFFVGYSRSVFPELVKSFPKVLFDYVLIDGSHRKEDALKDLQMVAPYVRRGGYVVFDDIGSYGPGIGYGLIDVWNTWKEEHKEDFRFREYHDPWGFAVALRQK